MNVLLTNQEITYEMLDVLSNTISFTKKVDRQYDSKFAQTGAKIGYVLNIRKPARSVDTKGQGIQLQDYIERSVPLTLNSQYQQAFAFTSSDKSLSLDDFSKRVIKPKMVQLCNGIDYDGLQQLIVGGIYNEVGTPGTIPNTSDTYLAAAQRLYEESVPDDEELSVHISPAMNRSIFPALQGLTLAGTPGFLQSLARGKGGRQDYTRGMITSGLGIDEWYRSQNVPTFTTGTQGGTPLVNGANQTGSSLITNGWTASTTVLNQGDVITIAGVYAVNPLTRQSTGALRQFSVETTVTSDGSGNATIPLSCVDGDGITTGGPYQTVTASPATSAAITVQGASAVSSPRGVLFHPQAFTFACADLSLYEGQDACERVADDELGLSIRFWAQPDINTDRLLGRLDLLGGWAVMYPQFACRIAS
jgi:hypothetical protein